MPDQDPCPEDAPEGMLTDEQEDELAQKRAMRRRKEFLGRVRAQMALDEVRHAVSTRIWR